MTNGGAGGAGAAGASGTSAGGNAGSAGSSAVCKGVVCDGQCVDPENDPNNCGSCGHACSAPTSACAAGQCACPNGGVLCNGTCIPSDDTNCGQCGNQCPSGWVCGGGSCGSQWALWPMPNPSSTGLPNPASYDASTPDVVVDNVTGLMWQRTVGADSHTWADAKAYCLNLTLAGHSDWRVPTEIELYSLVDFTRGYMRSAIDKTAFPKTPAGYFWSSSPVAGNASKAWFVDFDIGATLNFSVKFTNRVRCVRGGQAPSGSHYAVVSGAVQDNFTGLTWQQAVDAHVYGFRYAQTYCSSVALAGSGWRMPSVKELMTLVDFSVASPGPTIDATAFPNTPSRDFWSSSPCADGSRWAWLANFDSGATENAAMLGTYPVRCVR